MLALPSCKEVTQLTGKYPIILIIFLFFSKETEFVTEPTWLQSATVQVVIVLLTATAKMVTMVTLMVILMVLMMVSS